MKDTALHKLARWASGLRLEDCPARVRVHAVNQVLSTLAALYSGWGSDLGRPVEAAFGPAGHGPARVVPTGARAAPAQAAALMASWSMVLDYDDVMLGGHTGHSSVLVPLALGSAGGRSGGELVEAQIVANEVAARINMVCAVGSTRGQMATHLHLLAAAAARAKLEGLGAEEFAGSLAFAVSYPAQALYPAFLGSDAKALCAALPVRAGVEAVDAVRAGLKAPADPLEGPRGLFSAKASVPVRDFLGGLGERWHTETNSYKIYPACGYLCSALDATLDLLHEHDLSAEEVEAVDVWASLFTVGMDAHSAPYLDGPSSRISTLTFSTPFVIASALLARRFTPAELRREWIEDPRVWEMAARVKSRHDVRLTLEALTADIPIGAALRRTKRWQAAAFGWGISKTVFGSLGRLRRPETFRLVAGLAAAAGDTRPLDFTRSTKPMGARVEIRLKGGRLLSRSVSVPRGFAGAPASSAEGVRGLMREKFVAAASAAIGPERAARAAALIEDLEALSPADVARLVELACVAAPDPAPDPAQAGDAVRAVALAVETV
jgi:2-methylcitrate dehydratase PrpD